MTKTALSVFAWFDKFPLICALFMSTTRYIVELGLVNRKTKIDKAIRPRIRWLFIRNDTVRGLFPCSDSAPPLLHPITSYYTP